MRLKQLCVLIASIAVTGVSFSAPSDHGIGAMIGSSFALATRGATTDGIKDAPVRSEDLSSISKLVAMSSSTKSSNGGLVARGSSPSVKSLYAEVAPSVVLVLSEDGLGSGALISRSGEIVTNYHVVGPAKHVNVVFYRADGRRPAEEDMVTARVVRVNQEKDLALLKVGVMPCGISPMELTDAKVEIGAEVHAIGHPKGELWSYTRGYVSQVRGDYKWGSSKDGPIHQADVIQTQTPINPGNSGGPLFNSSKQLIGINSFGKTESVGLNYAISTSEVRKLLAQKSDVLLEKPKPEQAQKKNCGKEPINRMKSSNKLQGSTTVYQFDQDCDGKVESELSIADDKSKPNAWAFDTNGDGKFDVIVVDRDQDGKWDVTYVDTDHDGKPDAFALNEDGKLLASGKLQPLS